MSLLAFAAAFVIAFGVVYVGLTVFLTRLLDYLITGERKMSKSKLIALLVAAVLVLVALGTWATQILWNWLMPYLFGVPEISYWQALGLLVLSTLLFQRSVLWAKS